MTPTPSRSGPRTSTRRGILTVGLLSILTFAWVPRARSDFLYITDVGNNSIIQYNTATNAASVFATAAKIGGAVDAPFDIQEGPDGNLYFALLGTQRIMEYNETTKAFTQFNMGTSNSLAPQFPGYFAFQTASGANFILVNDFVNNQVLRFNLTTGAAAPSSGQTNAVYIPTTVGTATLNHPTGIATNAGAVYVSSSGTTPSQLLQYSAGGTSAINVGFTGSAIATGQTMPNAGAKVVAIPAGFAGGNVAISSFGDNNFYDYKNNGQLSYTASTSLNKPSGFAFSQTGTSVFIANSGAGNILQFDNTTPNGVLLATLSLTGAGQANTPIPLGIWDRATAIPTPLGPQPLVWPGPAAFAPEVPEPGSVVLLGIGLAFGTCLWRNRKPRHGSEPRSAVA